MTPSASRQAFSSAHMALLLLIAHTLVSPSLVEAFSVPNGAAFDRFQCQCPADGASIRHYDASLDWENKDDASSVWAAVYRSNNNLPTVLLKDDLLNSIRIATTPTATSDGRRSSDSVAIKNKKKSDDLITTRLSQETPVAVARLRTSKDFPNKFVLDSMRCWLKKEDTNADCDGGSEHKEALAVAIDALLLHYLNEHADPSETVVTSPHSLPVFEQTIRAKATLVSGQLLEERGFEPVQSLSRDMATHTSCVVDTCLEKYSQRTLRTPLNSNMQIMALQILSKLGLLDRNAEMEAAAAASRAQDEDGEKDEGDDDEYDPWAGMKQFI